MRPGNEDEDILKRIEQLVVATRRHPSENWCTATTRSGERCLMDAAADGLCKTHWRMANRGASQDADP